MAQVKLRRYSPAGTLTAEYIVDGFLVMRERQSQLTPALALPFTNATNNILLNLAGQNKIFTGNFIILPRSDDYTNGSGTPVAGFPGMTSQRKFLQDNIFVPSGYHAIVDENNDTTFGRFSEIEIIRQGDDPVQDSVSFTFSEGVTLI